jgi:hypothetical protein
MILNEENSQQIRIEITEGAKVSAIASLQPDYYPDNLFVGLDSGAVENLAGTANVAATPLKYERIEQWTGDTKKPELLIDFTDPDAAENGEASYYIHDVTEQAKHYARLVLVFDEVVDTRAANINFSGIVIANDAGTSLALTPNELKPNQDFSTMLQFNLTDDHRDTIGDWGKPGWGGLSDTELHIYLSEDSVRDRAGNPVLVKTIQKFAEAKVDIVNPAGPDPTNLIKENRFPYSTWEKDWQGAVYVSSTYNANNKAMTITFNEWMDQAPPDATTLDVGKITIKDKNEENAQVLKPTVGTAAAYTEQAKTKTVNFTLTPEIDVLVKERAKDLVGQSPQTIYMYLAEGAARDYSGVPSAAG